MRSQHEKPLDSICQTFGSSPDVQSHASGMDALSLSVFSCAKRLRIMGKHTTSPAVHAHICIRCCKPIDCICLATYRASVCRGRGLGISEGLLHWNCAFSPRSRSINRTGIPCLMLSRYTDNQGAGEKNWNVRIRYHDLAVFLLCCPESQGMTFCSTLNKLCNHIDVHCAKSHELPAMYKYGMSDECVAR